MIYKNREKLNLKLYVFGFDHMNSLCVLCISVTCIKSQITFPSWSIIQKYEVIDTTKRNRAINLILPPLARFYILDISCCPYQRKCFIFLLKVNYFTLANFEMKFVQIFIVHEYPIDLTRYFQKKGKLIYNLVISTIIKTLDSF